MHSSRLLFNASLLLVLALNLHLTGGQTFQYSRGWINGKRSELAETVQDGVVPSLMAASRPLTDTINLGEDQLSAVEPPCTIDQRDVIVLTRERMMQLLTHAMHSLHSVKVMMCLNPETKSTHLQAMF